MNEKRIYPFDTGAFLRGLYPNYISEFGHEGYNIASVSNAADLLIETFFGDDTSYFHGEAYNGEQIKRRANLDARHHEILALCALYTGQDCNADDRSRAIEFQTETDVPIDDQLLGCVLPRPLFDDSTIKAELKSRGVIVKHYDIYPLSTESYMALIYSEVKAIYQKMGVLDGR
ncbi:hypothetical protein V9K92_01120 [Phyllobacterium sp. CCNWLW109]|uniref:hypothetical protein n=1 Tax=Phyllobacterium sp. CCNWLW109 TaxID=3127479 RepID=UPI0030785127